ncbi:MAG TPA: Holliday junction resolvase RuvX [Acidiferrobacterales bacterium]|nr:Holliday junction resolvase RuvX [Acidiferrobacterales bacterium]
MSAPTYLGFDFGTKHLGIAVGGSASGLAEPLATASVRQGVPDWPMLDRLINEWKPAALIVGLPLNMDDSENAMTRAARKFGHRLHARYNLPVHMVDERLTSVDAKNTLVESRVPWKQRKAKVDKLAAQTILQAYLDEQRRPKMEPRHAADD